MSYRFQKIYYTILFTLFLACTPDSVYEPIEYVFVPQYLQIQESVGIKLDSNFASSTILMNIKLDKEGNYYIKVLDVKNNVVSKEKVTGNTGDNIFKVYTSTLPKSSYRIELFYESNKVGATSINLL